MTSNPHLEKLKATLKNRKLPSDDKPIIEKTIEKYQDWKATISTF